MLIEEILEEIENSGGKVISVDNVDGTVVVKYKDANGNVIEKEYQMIIGEDGSEDWVAV